MRKLLAVSVASTALLSASQALAADSTVSYDIQSTCEIGGLPNNIDISGPPAPGAASFLQRVTFIKVVCDDPNGATLSVATANGGLRHAEDPTIVVNYFIGVGPHNGLGPVRNFPQFVTDGTAGQSVSLNLLPTAVLADASVDVNARLNISGLDRFPFTFSGVYTDTVSVDISGNP